MAEERLCLDCKRPLRAWPYEDQYCSACRSLHGVEEGYGVVRSGRFPIKGRDRVAERLREGFKMMDEDSQ